MFEKRKEFYNKHKIKFISIFIAVFCITCLDLCAEELSTAKAKVYRENLVTEAKKYIGCPYVYGAVGPDSFDCSGLVYYVAKQANGTQLPRTAKALYSYVKIVPDKQKEPGDLLFFKTTSSGNVSHVGIYIGNNQFISALSDGPNNGVILSSLNEAYWKPKYLGVGQIYKSGKTAEEEFVEEPFIDDDDNESSDSGSVFDKIVFDGSLYGGWSLLQPNRFMINFRGVDLQTNARYTAIPLSPGLGVSLRYNFGLGVFQIPLLLNVTPSDYLRIYIGPVFTFGSPELRGSDDKIKQSIFPGIIGVSISTPTLVKKKKFKLQIVQDISYSVCNTEDGAALNFVDSVTAGLVFYTGVRVTLPLSIFIEK